MSTEPACMPAGPRHAVPERVRFLVASAGNHFMAELAEMFVEGFVRLGVAAGVEFDRLPPGDPPAGQLYVIVAPHEYFPLFAIPAVGRRWPAVAAGAWCLATEQPGGRCFEVGFRYAAACRGVFDINALGALEFRRRGVAAEYAPLGYAAAAEAPGEPVAERDLDIVFLGHDSPRRARFFAQYADRLARYRCQLVLNDPEQPRLAQTPGFVSGLERSRLLRRSRVLLNIHAADRPYFEWQRALYAMANGCLVVSESSLGAEPLCDGRHLVFAPLEALLDRCEEYLADEARRQEIANHAYRFLREEFTVEIGCRRMLDAYRRGLAHPAARPTVWSRAGRWLQQAAAQGRSVWFQLRGIPASLPAYLRRSRWAHGVYYPAKSLAGRLAGHWSLAQIERRRQAILSRLEAGAGARDIHPRSDYDRVDNDHYAALASPDIAVVVTVYNYAAYLGECLASVARSETQGLPGGIEAVIVDDASTDASAAVAAQWLKETPLPASLVRKRQNTGLADARNLGIALSRAPLVFILDADNRIYPKCLSKLADALRRSGAAAAYGIIRRFDGATGQGVDLVSSHAWDPARLVSAPYLDAMALFDRATLQELGGYSTELLRFGWFGLEDYDLWLKLARSGRPVAFCPEIVAEYRIHPASMLQATSHYKPRLVRYFRQKFADLAQRYPHTPRLFGWAR